MILPRLAPTACFISFLLLAPSAFAQEPNRAAAIIELKQSCLLGGTLNRQWIEPNKVAPTFGTDRKMQAFNLQGDAGEITIRKIENVDCEDEWKPDATQTLSQGIAIESPGWKVIPRKPRKIDPTDTTYVAVVRGILRSARLSKSPVKISEGYKVDLDGDGKDEVILVAAYSASGIGELTGVPNSSSAGDYAIVLVRKVVGTQVKNIFVLKDFRYKANEGLLNRAYHLSAIADLNGDNNMEIVLHSAYYEGSSSEVIGIKGTKAIGILACGCEH